MNRPVYHGGSYKVLSEKEIKKIHEGTMEILEKAGFKIDYKPALDLLEANGAKIDRVKNRAYIPRDLVSKCIKQAPGEFTFYGQEEGREIVLGGTRVHFGTGGMAVNVLDLDRVKRPSFCRDIADIAVLVEKLDYLDFFIVPVYPHDAPLNRVEVNKFFHSLCYTTKPVMGGIYSLEGLNEVVALASHIAGGVERLLSRPFIGFITSISSPLKIDELSAQLLLEVAAWGLPLATSTAPIAGITSPVTLAGTLVQQNAEALMGVILSQLKNPGTPILYSAVPSTMDLKTMAYLMGSIESGIMNAAITQMAHYYRLPCYITVGTSDSKLPDAQAAYESSKNCVLAALAGGNFIHEAAGLLEGALTASYAMYVIDNDIIGACLRTLRGVEVDDDRLAVDLIINLNSQGNYITQPHTIKYMRTESFFPQVSDRSSYSKWKMEGARDSWTIAEGIVRKILNGGRERVISDEMVEDIRLIYEGLIDVDGEESTSEDIPVLKDN